MFKGRKELYMNKSIYESQKNYQKRAMRQINIAYKRELVDEFYNKCYANKDIPSRVLKQCILDYVQAH